MKKVISKFKNLSPYLGALLLASAGVTVTVMVASLLKPNMSSQLLTVLLTAAATLLGVSFSNIHSRNNLRMQLEHLEKQRFKESKDALAVQYVNAGIKALGEVQAKWMRHLYLDYQPCAEDVVGEILSAQDSLLVALPRKGIEALTTLMLQYEKSYGKMYQERQLVMLQYHRFKQLESDIKDLRAVLSSLDRMAEQKLIDGGKGFDDKLIEYYQQRQKALEQLNRNHPLERLELVQRHEEFRNWFLLENAKVTSETMSLIAVLREYLYMEDVADWLMAHIDTTNRQLFEIHNPPSGAEKESSSEL